MGKYGEATGKLKLVRMDTEQEGIVLVSIGGFNQELTPKIGDKREFLKIINLNKDKPSDFQDALFEYIKSKIARDVPPLNDKEREELDFYVETWLEDLSTCFSVFYRLTSWQELKKQREELLQDRKKASPTSPVSS